MKHASFFFFAAISFLFILLPSFTVLAVTPYNSKRIFEIGFITCSALFILFRKKVYTEVTGRVKGFPTWVKVILGVLLAAGVISSALSKYPFYAFLELSIHFLLVMVLFEVVAVIGSNEQLFQQAFGVVLTLMILLYFIRFTVTYIYYFIYPGWPVWPETRFFQSIIIGEPANRINLNPFLGFSNFRFLNQVQTWMLPVLVLFIVQLPKKLWAYRSVLYFAAVFWWMLVFASDGRGTTYASLLSLVLVVIIFKSKIKKWAATYLTVAGIGFLGYLFFFKVLIPEGSRTAFSRFDDNARIRLGRYALDLFREHPFFGVGPMHYADIQNGFIFAHPHNFYLQILSEWGGFVFVSASVLFVFLLAKWIGFCRSERGEGNQVIKYAALSASLFAGLIHGFVSGVFHTPLSQILAVIIIGWTIAVYQKDRQSEAEVPPAGDAAANSVTTMVLMRTLLLAAVLMLVAGSILTYKRMPENRDKFLEQQDKQMIYPRFWDYGYIGDPEP